LYGFDECIIHDWLNDDDDDGLMMMTTKTKTPTTNEMLNSVCVCVLSTMLPYYLLSSVCSLYASAPSSFTSHSRHTENKAMRQCLLAGNVRINTNHKHICKSSSKMFNI
jgi:hypothetical protein